MSAVGAVPSLAALLAWPTEHLTEAAEYWEAIGGRCYEVANQIWRDSVSVDWQGEAADALRSATHADMMTTRAVADQLHEAAQVARSGASDLYAVRSRVRHAVEDADTARFDVSQDLSVTDRSSGGPPAQRAARQAQAQAFAGDIRQRAAQLVGLDQQVAAKIITAMAGIRTTFPPNPTPDTPPKDNRVHAVDHHWKQDPTPPPGPGAGGVTDSVSELGLPNYNPESLSDEEARRVYAEGKLRIIQRDEELARRGVSLEERAKVASANRNALRSWIRDIMSNRQGAEYLYQNEPNMTWDQVVAKYQAQGLSGDDLYRAIVEKSVGSRATVDAQLGIDPKNPGELPPVRPSAPTNLPAPKPPPPVEPPPAPKPAPVEPAPVEPPAPRPAPPE